MPGGEETPNKSSSRFALIAGGTPAVPTVRLSGPGSSLECDGELFALRAHCGRDARGPGSSLEWDAELFVLRAQCGRDAPGPRTSLEWVPAVSLSGVS